MADTKTITLTRLLDAPRELVFKAWTDPEVAAKWWGPDGVTIPTCEIDAKVGGKLYIVMLAGKELGPMAGQRWPMRGEFKEIIENEKIVFTNNAITEDGGLLIEGLTTVTLEEENGKTKLTMTTTAKAAAPEAPQMLDGMDAGWSQSLDKLVKYLKEV